MNPGGGSGREEPPLGIQIPDDARELDRDLLAYRREQRIQRRRSRLGKLTAPFGGTGTVMPLLASILAVCLVAGAMLSVATFGPSTSANKSHPVRRGGQQRAVRAALQPAGHGVSHADGVIQRVARRDGGHQPRRCDHRHRSHRHEGRSHPSHCFGSQVRRRSAVGLSKFPGRVARARPARPAVSPTVP